MTDYYAVQHFDTLSGQGLRVYRVSEDRIEWVDTVFASNLDDLINQLPVPVSAVFDARNGLHPLNGPLRAALRA